MFDQCFIELVTHARAMNQRRLLVLSGELPWCREQAQQALAAMACSQPVWVSDQPAGQYSNTPARQYLTYLGGECDALIYDAHSGLHPNALAALSGTLIGGGVLIVLAPPMAAWPDYDDPDYQRLCVYPTGPSEISGRFLQHFIDSLWSDPAAVVIEQGKASPVLAQSSVTSRCEATTVFTEQQQAVAAIMRVSTGHAKRPLVLQSDRGRGKSSALGIAAGKLLSQRPLKIVVTAPTLAAVSQVFQFAGQQCSGECAKPGYLQCGEGSLTFMPPDQLLRERPVVDLLLVDEAAALPAALLSRLLVHCNRMVFATTVHGYEGTGRGFEIRFKNTLNQQMPQWRLLELKQPIRWADQDPVERWLFEVFALGDDLPILPDNTSAVVSQCTVAELDRDQLLSQPVLLKSLFALLVSAHYQTSPDDLRHLLDGPNIRLWVSRCHGQLVAVALIAQEGGLDDAISKAIMCGERRPRGHLIPQSLAAHAGFVEMLPLEGWRVMRIAVHPGCQRRGIGSALLQQVTQQAGHEGLDWMGASFAASDDVLPFWVSGGYHPVRIGTHRDSSSGLHAAMMVKGVSPQGDAVIALMQQRFHQQLSKLLAEFYGDLEPALLAQLIATAGASDLPVLDDRDWSDVRAFGAGARIYESCYPALWNYAYRLLAEGRCPQGSQQRDALISKLLLAHSWKAVADRVGLPGKKQVLVLLRQVIADSLANPNS